MVSDIVSNAGSNTGPNTGSRATFGLTSRVAPEEFRIPGRVRD